MILYCPRKQNVDSSFHIDFHLPASGNVSLRGGNTNISIVIQLMVLFALDNGKPSLPKEMCLVL